LGYIEAILLGIVQGLTEFLPVSSSGHLELGKVILGDTSLPKESMMFTVVVHFATALSTLVVFRQQVWHILWGLMQTKDSTSWLFSGRILLSMIPAALVGVFFSSELEQLFDRQILLVGIMLLLTGGLLIAADRQVSAHRTVTTLDSLIIGVAQAIAILPGISRSGATISCSVMLGIRRQDAAEFSFLMVVPLILGKIAKDLLDGALHLSQDQWGVLIAGFFAAFISGLIACQWMVTLVRNAKLKYFAYYCFVVGSAAILYRLSEWA
jgi:undecaprenyl-diphosphatase